IAGLAERLARRRCRYACLVVAADDARRRRAEGRSFLRRFVVAAHLGQGQPARRDRRPSLLLRELICQAAHLAETAPVAATLRSRKTDTMGGRVRGCAKKTEAPDSSRSPGLVVIGEAISAARTPNDRGARRRDRRDESPDCRIA